MFVTKIALLGLLLAVSDRFTVDALSKEEKELLKIAKEAADRSFDQETLHESIWMDSRHIVGDIFLNSKKVAVERVQERNASGSRNVYAIVSYYNSLTYIPSLAKSYVMGELVLDGVAWARVLEGEYEHRDLPKDWFSLKDEFVPDLRYAVLDQHDQATGKRVRPSLMKENVLSIEETEDSTPGTRCFKVTPKTCFGGMLAKYMANEPALRIDTVAVEQTFCVEGGFLVKHIVDSTASGYDSMWEDVVKWTTISTNLLSKFGEPVEIPDPTKPADHEAWV